MIAPFRDLRSSCCLAPVRHAQPREPHVYVCSDCKRGCGAVLGPRRDRVTKMVATALAALALVAGLLVPGRAAAEECPSDRCVQVESARKCLRYARKMDDCEKLQQEATACESARNELAGKVTVLQEQLTAERNHADELSAELAVARREAAQQQQRADKRVPKWLAVAGGVGALLIGGAAGYGVAQLVP